MNDIIHETNNFTLVNVENPLISREEGGHIIITMKNPVTDRTKLNPGAAKELMRLTMLAGEAMETAMNNRGIPVVKINYADFGNGAFRSKNPKPQLHVHIFGRAKNAVKQKFPNPPYLAGTDDPGFFDNFEPLDDEDIEEIQKQIALLEKLEKYNASNW